MLCVPSVIEPLPYDVALSRAIRSLRDQVIIHIFGFLSQPRNAYINYPVDPTLHLIALLSAFKDGCYSSGQGSRGSLH